MPGSVFQITNNRISVILRLLTLIYCVAIVGYVVARAWSLSFTHDEAFTFTRYVLGNFWDVVLYRNSEPNNHMLNSVLMKLFSAIGGNHPFVLRLPSVLAFLVYLYFIFRLLREFKNDYLLFIGMLLATCNPFFLEFFSMARGYAGAHASVAAALYFSVRYINSDFTSTKQLIYATLASGISVLFHLAMLNFFLPFIFILFSLPWLYLVRKFGFNLNKSSERLIAAQEFKALLMVILFLAFVLPVVYGFKDRGEFAFAGKEGFWTDTVGSLFWYSIYFQPYPAIEVLWAGVTWFTWIILAIAFALAVYQFIKRKENPIGLHHLLLLLNAGCAFFIIAQHYFLNNTYPVERFASFFIPLFMLLTALVFFELFRHRFAVILPLLFVFFNLYHLYNTANFTHTLGWRYDADTRQVLKDWENIIENDRKGNSVSLGVTFFHEPSVNYYRFINNKYWMQAAGRENFHNRQRYLYLEKKDSSLLSGWVYKIEKEYPVSQTWLVKNLRVDTSMPVFEKHIRVSDTGDVVMELLHSQLPWNEFLLVEAKVEAQLKNDKTLTNLVIFKVDNGNTVYWQENYLTRIWLRNARPEVYYYTAKLPPAKDSSGYTAVKVLEANDRGTEIKSLDVKIYRLNQ